MPQIAPKIIDFSKIPKTGRVKNDNWTPSSVDAQEVEYRRGNKDLIQQLESLMPIAPEGVEPFVDENGETLELPFVCEVGKKRQKGQVSMTETKKAFITRERGVDFKERQFIGQKPFCCAQGETPEYGQLAHFLDDPSVERMPFCTRTTPHHHCVDNPDQLINLATQELCEVGANHGRVIKKLTKIQFDAEMAKEAPPAPV